MSNARAGTRVTPETAIALTLLVVFAMPRVLLAMRTQDFGHDGALYADVALHVSAGHGLVSSVSDFHHGFRSFPHPTSLYPAWPLLLGAALAVLPLKAAGVWFPAVLSQLALCAAYLLGRRVTSTSLVVSTRPFLNAGHVFLIMLGCHDGFFAFSTRPYTEPLAFLLLMLFLWRAFVLISRRSWLDGLELGGWIAALIYVRAHFLVFAAAAMLALLLELALRVRASRATARDWTFPLVVGAASVALLAPFLVYMNGFVDRPGIGTYLRYDQARAIGADVLSPLTAVVVKSPSLAHKLATLGGGFVRSFSPSWKHGYGNAVDALAWGPPLALLVSLAWVIARRRMLRDHWAAMLEHPKRAGWLLLLGCAAAGFLSLHAIHKSWGTPWYFAGRHGLTAVLLFSLAWIAVLSVPWRAVTIAGLLVFGVGTVRSLKHQLVQTDVARGLGKNRPLGNERPALARWLVEKQRAHGSLVVAVSQGLSRKLAWRLPASTREHIGLHQMYPEMGLDDAFALTGPLGARYLVITADRFAPDMLAEAGFFEAFEFVELVREERTRKGRGAALVYRRRSAVPGPLYLPPVD